MQGRAAAAQPPLGGRQVGPVDEAITGEIVTPWKEVRTVGDAVRSGTHTEKIVAEVEALRADVFCLRQTVAKEKNRVRLGLFASRLNIKAATYKTKSDVLEVLIPGIIEKIEKEPLPVCHKSIAARRADGSLRFHHTEIQ